MEISDNQKLSSPQSWWQQQSIRFKTTALAIAIGTVPTLTLASVAYYFANQSISREIIAAEEGTATSVADRVAFYMRERYGDIQIMAGLSVLTNANLRSQTSISDKQAALDQFIKAYTIYDSIAAFDLNGNVIAQSTGQPLSNHKSRSYFQEALKIDGPILSQPIVSKSSGISAVYLASPIKDSTTKKTVGIIRARIPIKYLRDVILASDAENNYLLDNQGRIFAASSESEHEAIQGEPTKSQPASSRFDIYQQLRQSQQKDTQIAEDLLISYIPFSDFKDEFRAQLPNLGWSTITTVDQQIAFAPQRQMRQVFLLGTGVIALGVGAIAFSLANRLLRPILKAAVAVEAIGRGNFTTRVNLPGSDEIAQLGNNINLMATRLSEFVQAQALLAQQSETLKNITLEFAVAADKVKVLQIAVVESRTILKAERVIYYHFDDNFKGMVTAESVAPGLISIQGLEIYNPDLVQEYAEKHQQGNLKIQVINDRDQANISQSHRAILESFKVQASLTIPVVIENQLDGLLIAHQCAATRHWQPQEVELLTQIANQIGLAVARQDLLRSQERSRIREKEAKEAIQSRALELLKEVYEVSEGDLTIRAKVTEDEIGTIADSYNSTIESLQKLVTQVKTAAIEVKANTVENDLAVQELAKETIAQAEQISLTLGQVYAMNESIRSVSINAAQAENFVQQANITIATGDQAMNQTVAEINAIQTTVTETTVKVQRLGDSSQEISQAVNLIGRFAAQTHLLALKASIEAARAGEKGKGFAVIADEVRSLATQSAAATAEIDNLVTKIQSETNEVVKAMNTGTKQVAAGTELVQQTRQSLNQISAVSDKISHLVGAISHAASLQSETSEQVSQTMTKVAAIAENNSQSATQVSTGIKQLSAVAEKLQAGIGKFKT
jgi:methyl-accepting chemotaxis protein PixJ